MSPGAVAVAIAALGAAAAPCWAYVDVKSEYTANIVQSTTRWIGSGATASGTTITGTANLPGPGGSTVPTRVAIEMSRRSLVVAAARVLPVIAVGSALWEVYTAMRVQVTPGGPLFDKGIPKENLESWACTFQGTSTGYAFASLTLACEAATAAKNTDSLSDGCYVTHKRYSPAGFGTFDGAMHVREQRTYSVRPGWVSPDGLPCAMPASTEVLQLDAAGGGHQLALRCQHGSPSPFDGKCLSKEGGDYVPATDDDVGGQYDKKPDFPKLDDVNWPGVAGDVANNATDTKPAPAPGLKHKTEEPYPATVPGGTVTTTNPDGTVTETATGWNIRPAFTFPTNPGKSTWDKTTTKTTKDSQGNVVATETTTTKPSVEAPAEDPCSANPDRAGCAKLGEVEDAELSKRDVQVMVQAMEGWVPSSDACPAPPTFTAGGFTLTWDNSLVCNAMRWIKGVLLAGCALASALIVIGGFKSA